MTDLNTLISVVNAHAANENKVRFGGKDKLKVEQNKIEVTKLEQRVVWDWHYGVPNDFCVFIDVLDPHAAYVFVKLEDDVLKRTLVVSDGKDYRDYRELPPLERSLDENEIARQLIESVVAATSAS
jgi:hypothetical protein